MKNCVFNHNIITLTLPCSLLFLWRFYYPVLAVNYYHLRVFVKEAVLLISTYISWKHLGAWGLKFPLFQNNAASSSWGADPAPPQGKGAAETIVSLSTVFSKYSLPANFWGLKVSALSVSCLFVSPTKERRSKKRPDKYWMSRPRVMQLDAGLLLQRCCIPAQGVPCCRWQQLPHWWDRASSVTPCKAEVTSQVLPDMSCQRRAVPTDVLSLIVFSELSADHGLSTPRPKCPVIVFSEVPTCLMHLFFSCLVCPRFLVKYLKAFLLSLFIMGGDLFFKIIPISLHLWGSATSA